MVVLLAKFQNGYGFKPPTQPTKMQQKICSSWEAVCHYISYICFKLTFSIKYKVLEAYFLLLLRAKHSRGEEKFGVKVLFLFNLKGKLFALVPACNNSLQIR